MVRAASAKIVGAERASAPQKTMGAEDFSFFLQECPGKNQRFSEYDACVLKANFYFRIERMIP